QARGIYASGEPARVRRDQNVPGEARPGRNGRAPDRKPLMIYAPISSVVLMPTPRCPNQPRYSPHGSLLVMSCLSTPGHFFSMMVKSLTPIAKWRGLALTLPKTT